MDKTVRLWHVSRDENLCTFKHSDFIPAIQFHPTDDRFFLAGSLDSKLRLWSIPDKTVAFVVSVPEMITAVSFTPDGKTCIAGTLGGLCVFYDTEGLKWQSQLHVKSTRGQNAKGSKITGIQATHWPPGSESDEVKLMISSNDSRLRIYNLKDKTLEMKFKGHENNCSQIRATFVESSGHIICGSEDCKAYIWSVTVPEGDKKNQRPVEMFEAHDSITTCTVFAPLQTKQLLSASEDPIYDMCNPPPVTLISKAESVSSSRAPTEAGSAHPTPAPTDTHFRKAPESPAYLARCAHHGGNIIITADYTGSLKVFRQDCAFTKRLRMREWDMASKKGRPSSILSRTSRSRRDSVSTQPPNDRIMTWRQDISNGSLHSPSGSIHGHKRRSMSPRKAMATLDASLAQHSDFISSPPRDTMNATHPSSKRPTSPSLDRTPARSTNPSAHTSPAPSRAPTDDTSEPASSAPLNISSDANPLAIYNGQSWAFWTKAERNRERERQRPQLDARLSQLSQLSQVSRLTSEMSDAGLEERDAKEQQRGSGAGACAHCGGADFVRVDGGRGWACKRCGEME
jgi:WD40 repeat protein